MPLNIKSKKVALFVGTILTLAFCLTGYLTIEFIKVNPSVPIQLINPPEDCDLQVRDCRFQLPDGNYFEVSVPTRPIQSNEKMRMFVVGDDSKFKPLALDLNGEKMNMGFNRPDFRKRENGRYEAMFTLSTCTLKKLKWRAIVLFSAYPDKTIGVPILFEVSNP